MKKKALVLKGREILERSGQPNAHQLSLKMQVSYPTVDRLVNKSQAMTTYDRTVLAALLLEGLGLTEEEALALPLGVLFNLAEVEA